MPRHVVIRPGAASPLRALCMVAAIVIGALAAAGSGAAAATTAAFAPLEAEVLARRAANDRSTPRERRAFRALGRIGDELAILTSTLAGDLRVAVIVGRSIRRDFRDDAGLATSFASAVDELTVAARAERERLALWMGRLDADREARLVRGLAHADGKFARAQRQSTDTARARLLERACRALEATRSGLDLWDAPDPPPREVVADFSLTDVNPDSPTHGVEVSPRQYLGKVSAWYFGKAG